MSTDDSPHESDRPPEGIAKAPTERFDGTALINVRLLEKAGELLLVEKPGERVTLDELSRGLRLVELHTLSRRVLYDRTAKASTVEDARALRERLEEKLGRGRLQIHASSMKDSVEILDRGVEAMRSSQLLLEDFAFDSSIDRPVSDEAAATFRSWLERAAGEPEENLQDLAREAIEVNFRGAKCLAAITASGPRLVRHAWSLFEDPALDDRRLVGAFINRFRLNYLNRLAIDDRGAFCPDLPFESLTVRHMKLFADYLVRVMVQESRRESPDSDFLVRNLSEDFRLPPIGLLLLMSCEEKGAPLELFHRGEEMLGKSDRLKRYLWGVSADALDQLEIEEEIEDIFHQAYAKMRRQAKLGDEPGALRRYLLPIVPSTLGVLSGEAVSALGDLSGLLEFFTRLAGAASPTLLTNRLETVGASSYLTQYNRLQDILTTSPSLRRPFEEALALQVERVFRRRLVFNGS